MKKPRELKIVGQKPVAAVRVPTPAEVKSEITFDQWWVMVLGEKKLKPELKIAIKKHFEARGFMLNRNFEDGLKDFGI